MPDHPPRQKLLLLIRDAGRKDDEPFAIRVRRGLKTLLRRDKIRVVSIAPAPTPEKEAKR